MRLLYFAKIVHTLRHVIHKGLGYFAWVQCIMYCNNAMSIVCSTQSVIIILTTVLSGLSVSYPADVPLDTDHQLGVVLFVLEK